MARGRRVRMTRLIVTLLTVSVGLAIALGVVAFQLRQEAATANDRIEGLSEEVERLRQQIAAAAEIEADDRESTASAVPAPSVPTPTPNPHPRDFVSFSWDGYHDAAFEMLRNDEYDRWATAFRYLEKHPSTYDELWELVGKDLPARYDSMSFFLGTSANRGLIDPMDDDPERYRLTVRGRQVADAMREIPPSVVERFKFEPPE